MSYALYMSEIRRFIDFIDDVISSIHNPVIRVKDDKLELHYVVPARYVHNIKALLTQVAKDAIETPETEDFIQGNEAHLILRFRT